MPTYEYDCGACGKTFEKFQSIKAAPLKNCILCGKPKAKRRFGTGAGLIFKGSGFYITDYRSDSYKEKAKSETGTKEPAKSDSADKNASKPTETKPAAEAPKPAAKPEPKPHKKK